MEPTTNRPARRRVPVGALLAAALCAAPLAHLAAQNGTGSIYGMIADESKRPLAGAGITLESAVRRANALRDGSYRIPDVTEGSHRLIVRYMGYQPETVMVSVNSGHVTHADVSLHRPIQQLDAIRVESNVAGQAAALNQQKAGDNLSSVVDAELVGRLPDRNLAEALGRVPGVALVRDQGEGRYVQIRGMDASLNTLSIDGMRTPSPEPAARQTPMDVIPSDMVAAIQVNKTLTPDLDADAIGGNANLITRTARTGMPVASFSAAGGQNRINDGGIKNVTGYVGSRFGTNDRLGVVVGGSFYQTDRGSQNFEQGWCVETTCKGVAAANAPDAPTQLALRDYSQVLRTRKGGNGTLDYRFDDNNAVFLKGFYSRFSDDEQRYVTLANFSSGTYAVADANHGAVTGARMDKELRLRPVAQSQGSIQFGGQSLLPASTALDYTLQVARAREDRPQTLTMLFRESSMDFTYDVSQEDRPHYVVTKGAETDASKFAYNSLRQQTRHVLDDDKSGRVNLSRPFALGMVNGMLKIGGAARLKDRTSVDTSNRFLATFKPDAPAPSGAVTLATVQGQSRTGHFLDGSYVFGPQASAGSALSFWDTYHNSLGQDVPRSIVESTSGNFAVGEDVYAGYAMATLDAGPVRIIPGVRLENTRQKNTGYLVKQAGTNVTVTPQTRTINYTNAFPSLTARWSIDDQTYIRGAVTRSLVRPAFGSMTPFITIPDGNGVVASIGNPDLLPTRALNLDLEVERYLRSVGFVSAGVFHKKLDDFIFSAQRNALAGDNLGPTVITLSQPVNGATGTLDGYELAWQQNLTFLPSVLSGLGVNANYTRTSSSTTLPSREGTKSRLPGQAGNAANVGLFYEYSRLSLRGGYNFSDQYLEVVGATPLTDVYVASRGQLDVSGNFRVTPQVGLFLETNNLTNQPLRRYIGKSVRGWAPGDEYYRSWGMFGVRVQP
ncbi:MAG TPA: TonB-dependent receptor [Gemmatimonadaceae bacterium]|nr:TonB-dependent receptor [Gemmatimonadaceae bacterium]